jgi:NADPH:quinone reductase-like Zn-dependent oxidoreductase
MQKPKAFPYIGGGDCSGVVVAVGAKQSAKHDKFDMGDQVYATFVSPNPLGCLAEYCVVKQALAAKKPAGLSFLEASTLASSAVTAQTLVETHVQRGDRVLVLGGTGGVGCFLVQMAKAAGASFVAATSSKPRLLAELGVDRAVDYSAEKWWDLPEFMGELRFDVIVDLVGGKESWEQAKRCKVVKSAREGGRFATTTFDNPNPRIHNCFHVIGFMLPLMGHMLWAGVNKSIPAFKLTQGVPNQSDAQPKFRRLNEKFLQTAGDGGPESESLRVVLDPAGPFSFSAQGLKDGYNLQNSRHVKGKAVVELA